MAKGFAKGKCTCTTSRQAMGVSYDWMGIRTVKFWQCGCGKRYEGPTGKKTSR
jgi:hypothetical protein